MTVAQTKKRSDGAEPKLDWATDLYRPRPILTLYSDNMYSPFAEDDL